MADGLQKLRAYRFAGWELNVRLRKLTSPSGEAVALTNNEFNLLAAFLAAPQRLLSRDQLLGLSRLHNDEVYDRSIDVQVGRLRKKIQPDETQPPLIRTERGARVMSSPRESRPSVKSPKGTHRARRQAWAWRRNSLAPGDSPGREEKPPVARSRRLRR